MNGAGGSRSERNDRASSLPSARGDAPALLRRPFAHLNLRRNPFGEVDRSERAALVVADLDEAAERLRRPGFAFQVVGDSGRGKTSHLLALEALLPEASYVKVVLGRPTTVPAAGVVLIDEVQHLPAGVRRRLFRRAGVSFALGSREDLSEELVAAGLEVRCLWPSREVTPERLEHIFRLRVEWARRGPGPLPMVPRRTVERLISLHGDDLRAMEGALYEAFQRAREVGDVEV